MLGWLYKIVKDCITIQYKINIFGVTTAYCLSFLNFQTCFDAYFSMKNSPFACVCSRKCCRSNLNSKLLKLIEKIWVTAAYYLSFLNFQTCFDVYFFVKNSPFACICLQKCCRRNLNFFYFRPYSTVIVCDRTQVSISGSKTMVQFQYWYQSRNFFSETETFCFIFFLKLQIFLIFAHFLGDTQVFYKL